MALFAETMPFMARIPTIIMHKGVCVHAHTCAYMRTPIIHTTAHAYHHTDELMPDEGLITSGNHLRRCLPDSLADRSTGKPGAFQPNAPHPHRGSTEHLSRQGVNKVAGGSRFVAMLRLAQVLAHDRPTVEPCHESVAVRL